MSRILIIEEQKKARKSLVSVFKRDGFEICDGIEWESAAEIVRKNVYDLIVVVLDEKPSVGYEMLKTIKICSADAEIIAIVPPDRYGADQMVSYGVYDCIPKPVRQKDIVAMGKKALEKKQLADKVRSLQQIMDMDKLTL
ncbi:MAG: response regulator [Candidatus Brocadia sp.]|nr:response regulator [Candidatus Brocadia sp.]NUO07392.1 response regulator [Candidatus Brocadia sp.]